MEGGQEEEALSRILLVPVEEEGVTQEMLLDQLANFSLDDAHCYDPNEENKLLSIIDSLGCDFNKRIQTFFLQSNSTLPCKTTLQNYPTKNIYETIIK